MRACYNSIWSWSPMSCEKHDSRASVTTKPRPLASVVVYWVPRAMFVIWHGRPWSNPTTVTHWPVFGQASRLMTNRMFCCSIWGDDALPVVSIPEGDGLDDGCLGCTTTYPKTTVVHLCKKTLFICITDETIVMYWCDQRDYFLVQQYTLTEMI